MARREAGRTPVAVLGGFRDVSKFSVYGMALALAVFLAALTGCSKGPDYSGLGYVTPSAPDDTVLLLPESAIALIYVSAKDCIYCARWEEARLPEWESSKLRGKIRFFRVESPSFRDTSQRYWPDEVAWVLGKTWARAGTPRFIVVVDDEIFVNTIGARSWDTDIYPALEMLVERRARLKASSTDKS